MRFNPFKGCGICCCKRRKTAQANDDDVPLQYLPVPTSDPEVSPSPPNSDAHRQGQNIFSPRGLKSLADRLMEAQRQIKAEKKRRRELRESSAPNRASVMEPSPEPELPTIEERMSTHMGKHDSASLPESQTLHNKSTARYIGHLDARGAFNEIYLPTRTRDPPSEIPPYPSGPSNEPPCPATVPLLDPISEHGASGSTQMEPPGNFSGPADKGKGKALTSCSESSFIVDRAMERARSQAQRSFQTTEALRRQRIDIRASEEANMLACACGEPRKLKPSTGWGPGPAVPGEMDFGPEKLELGGKWVKSS
ncbi:MAG: hypothetical protein M1820_002010 [Bogoriella megaspora]|nr:MAG: hypothetical protein M1820_002010 [Bogoriella megaspora]